MAKNKQEIMARRSSSAPCARRFPLFILLAVKPIALFNLFRLLMPGSKALLFILVFVFFSLFINSFALRSSDTRSRLASSAAQAQCRSRLVSQCLCVDCSNVRYGAGRARVRTGLLAKPEILGYRRCERPMPTRACRDTLIWTT